MSEIVTVAERLPVAVGVKVTVMRQVPSGLTVPGSGQVVAGVILKSPGSVPASVMAVMLRPTEVPVLVSVELNAALVVPTATDPKFRKEGTSVALVMPLPPPEPVRLMVCDPPVALSFTVTVAERDPLAEGVKVTVIRQVPSGAMVPELGQVLAEVMAKSPGLAPVSVMLVMFRAMVVLVSVSVED